MWVPYHASKVTGTCWTTPSRVPKAFLRGMVQHPYHEDGSGPQDDMQQKETNPYHPWNDCIFTYMVWYIYKYLPGFGGFLWVFMSGKYIRPRPMDASPRTSLAHRLVLPKPPPKRQKKRTCRRRHDAGHKPKRRGNIRGHLKLRFGIWTTQKIPINILKHRTSGGIWMSRCPEKVGLYDLFHGELGMKHRDFLLQKPR